MGIVNAHAPTIGRKLLPDLAEMQKRFQQFILDNEEAIYSEISAAQSISVETRLEIYQEAYYSRLLDVLKKEYPVLLAMLGSEAFEVLAYQYIHVHPSFYQSIRWYGDKLSSFIRKQVKTRNRGWQAELAAFEWLLTIAFDAPDEVSLVPDDMAKISIENWPKLRFQLHPSVQIISLRWNVPELWNAFKEKGSIIKPLRLNKSVPWIIWRKNLAIYFKSLSVDELYALKTIRTGKNFSAFCKGLCRFVGLNQAAPHAALLLKEFMLDHLLIADF